ncbi:Homeodomain-like DNA binding domain-containing transcription factor [Phycomyces blakesleeanus NRRL 1555(-)]|uniref:Homeodomain-like DNA binding domain-containing transcription factor n=1 Tax=Phycomyces blakesleeanus (strain ATCC 8743b / DSM 1359 / FGSC 10004 / NBRC 33097 / NRRL 1555) TaxID=763407 RepID=A0A162ZKV8_PHYB8|nr:Homeodomain-like DNA binding domain-containing transcription factor [Phycomyces blakesleeanus NRRL 1555(-)]OAD67491.1 Homeodomain-like DNA binding domain-containing transcription factor [Phycomyces blakesleeanus NRRL 1555(-)]|eukprot:XP_018285531.1 Homeodomain-like DNA binding domain-containing transcription factor [Phycomyces blakesleeanus NRRL 1555(-)]
MSQEINKDTFNKRKEISDYEKGLIVGGALQDVSLTAISEKTGIPLTTVHRTVKRWKQNGTALTVKRKGRQAILGERDLGHLKNEIKKNPKTTLGELTIAMRNVIGNYVSKNTVRKGIRKIEMSSCHAVIDPMLSEVPKNK